MTEPRYTPGPWEISDTRGRGNNLLSIRAGLCGVARINATLHADANAHLIAAAPELYEIAQMYLDWGHLSPAQLEAKYPEWERTEGVRYIDAKARAALAKARGE